MQIVEFMRARLDEDEAESRLEKYSQWWVNEDGPFDPDRVRIEITAKRAILARYESWAMGGEDGHPLTTILLGVVQALAAVYVDHPDFDKAMQS